MAYVSAGVLTLQFTAGGIVTPCVKVSRGIRLASIAPHNTQFNITYTYVYFVGGQPRSTNDNQNVSTMNFVADIDTKWSRCQGKSTQLSGTPDRGSRFDATVCIRIKDAAGNWVEQCDSDTYTQNAP